MKTKLRIGTSGFSFDDWSGPFYPRKLNKTRMFEFYTTVFDTVEINSTYYAIPKASVLESLVKRSPSGFLFTIKAHQSATHSREDMRSLMPAYLEALKPFSESTKLAGILLQFPQSFHRSDTNIDHLRLCRQAMPDLPLFVEFRHRSWLVEGLSELFRELEFGYVAVDEPKLPGLLPPVILPTGRTGYIRFHGRNAEAWHSGDGAERYNYLYVKEELEEWRPGIEKLGTETDTIFAFFNNCRFGKAAINAIEFRKMFGLEIPEPGGFVGSFDF